MIKFKSANIITISPADLKKIPDFELFLIPKELKLTRARTGNVPRANASIVKPPFKKDVSSILGIIIFTYVIYELF